MDEIDKRILRLLQLNAQIQIAELGDKAGISPSACWRRIRILEKEGVIRGRVALLDRHQLNLGLVAMVAIRTNRHHQEWMKAFTKTVTAIPEVVDFFRMSGEIDYLIRIVVPDMNAYDAVYKRLINAIDIFDVSASFVMEEIKSTTALPLDYMSGRTP
jgi:Lrp/AsnC family transcriptional regulator